MFFDKLNNKTTLKLLDLLIKMNLRLYLICVVAVFFLMGSAVAGSTATIHGAVYKWDTFEPLNNTVIEINSTPTQNMVAKDGQYSVKLAPGNYTITAKYYQNSVLIYFTEEIIEIKDGESYVLDLLLPPVNSEESMDNSKVDMFSESLNKSVKNPSQSPKSSIPKEAINKINTSNGVSITERSLGSVTEKSKQNKLYFSIIYYLLIALMSFLLFIGGYRLFRMHKKVEINASQGRKNGNILKYFFEFLSMPDLLVNFFTKGGGSEIRQEFKTAEEALSIIELDITELESKIPKREILEESREECPAQETELVESRLEKENRKISLEESAYNLKIETPALKKELVLPTDLQDIMDTIRSQGGQISQKDLRKRLKYSEVKVSLMLADLEKRKRIKKFKRGRENFIVLIDKKH
jgi:uncharacterized membrane protein